MVAEAVSPAVTVPMVSVLAGPVAPVAPVYPLGPVSPVSPFGPCWPVSPFYPLGPVAPFGMPNSKENTLAEDGPDDVT